MVKYQIRKYLLINKKLLNLKNIERKLIILYKEYGKKEYNRIVISIELKENIKKIINELKNKKIEDIMNLKKYKMDIITSEIIQRERRKIEEEEEEKRREEYEKRRKEEEKRRKEEEEKRRKEEEEKMKINENKKINGKRKSKKKNKREKNKK